MTTTRIEELFLAIKADDAAGVSRLLDAQPDLATARDERGVSVLLRTLYCGAGTVRVVLLARRPNLDVFEAAAVGDAMRLAELLAADPGSACSLAPDGFTPAALAAFFGHLSCLRMLLHADADPNAPAANDMRVTALHAAAAHRDSGVALEMVRLLLDRGASPNVTQHGGWTPLHQAAAHGPAEMVRTLLDHGADPNAASDDGRTPAAMATGAGHSEVAWMLREAGGTG